MTPTIQIPDYEAAQNTKKTHQCMEAFLEVFLAAGLNYTIAETYNNISNAQIKDGADSVGVFSIEHINNNTSIQFNVNNNILLESTWQKIEQINQHLEPFIKKEIPRATQSL